MPPLVGGVGSQIVGLFYKNDAEEECTLSAPTAPSSTPFSFLFYFIVIFRSHPDLFALHSWPHVTQTVLEREGVEVQRMTSLATTCAKIITALNFDFSHKIAMIETGAHAN